MSNIFLNLACFGFRPQIAQLNTDVECVKIDQMRLEQELDFILGQQRELEDILGPLEQAMEQLPPINYSQHADVEREHTYVNIKLIIQLFFSRLIAVIG